mmetsp:Transcript_13614/g.18672  ORF Transcript_13614/g.18672 Transcript_13614/m.18672 type:complete len:128 (-) Transcript_13614:116-499(-)|eukprot:CAMPEP_0196592062 /NCGR_PEP_ID=MMETSP1081-20130531/71715_1 /TAXON_ID=36882 /ORGANISM="Pyramimonas amylifera, Strain CCMP720" /LENGTH=127 /DNA_ID=CAMNT_0041915633 /DNA_START=107 /DNA_END=490 /DNA_ORIENTATION=+
MASDPRFDVNEDGTAKNPIAFRQALREDTEKIKIIEEDPQLAEALLGDDTNAMQEVLKSVYQMSKVKAERDAKENENMTSVDKLRAHATVPRDPVVLYEGMLQAGLQYGPAFRLLTDVYVPDDVTQS